MKKTKSIDTLRIKFICQFLDIKKRGTIPEMLEFVNDRLTKYGEKEIADRKLRDCISKLRKGDFEHSLSGAKNKHDLFKIKITNKNIYSWDKASKRPEFGDLEPNERFTLPFLVGILSKYQNIPAVQKIFYMLPEIFNLEHEEMQSSSAIVHLTPDIYDESKKDFQENVIECVINILTNIHLGQCIIFNYSFVNKADSHKMYEVAPLQIRFYENYYYLIAEIIEKKVIKYFRVDQIDRLKVETYLDENEQPILFDKEKYAIALNKHFEHSLGIWSYPDGEGELNYLVIEFSYWAASYIKHLKFHPSQEIVEEDKTNSKITVGFKLMLSKEKEQGQPPNERSNELAFLLGRFREYAVIKSCRPV